MSNWSSDVCSSDRGVVVLLFWRAAGLFVIAMIDLPVQLFRRMTRLKMTLQEVRDEHKDSEGAPEKKAAIKERQRMIAMGGLVPAMKEAQFVITNRSVEHTSELQSLMRISYAVFCLKKKKTQNEAIDNQ